MSLKAQGRVARYEPRQLNNREGESPSLQMQGEQHYPYSSDWPTLREVLRLQSVKRGETASNWKPHPVAAKHESTDSESKAASELS